MGQYVRCENIWLQTFLWLFGVSEQEPDTGNNEWEISWEGNRRVSRGTDGVWAEEHETGGLEQCAFILMLIDTPSQRRRLVAYTISTLSGCQNVSLK